MSAELEPGTVIAKRYSVRHPLGKGGMGEVYAAQNTRTGRMVAVKVLRAEAKGKSSAVERFRREARAAGSINSDHVTQVLDVEDDPEHGIVLVFELLEGESLVERLKRTGPVPFEELWTIVEAVWMGLCDAHAAGIVHRDLKPSNVFLLQGRTGSGRVKILDFGISKLPKEITTQSLTQVGQNLGTFSFMPPEQIGKAKTVDHRADIYAATTLIYQALSGKLPYQAKNVVTMMELKSKTEPRTLSAALGVMVDDRLEAFIARGLARNPDARFQSALEALDAWRALRPPGVPSLAEESSGIYTNREPPSSSEQQTMVVKRPLGSGSGGSGSGGSGSGGSGSGGAGSGGSGSGGFGSGAYPPAQGGAPTHVPAMQGHGQRASYAGPAATPAPAAVAQAHTLPTPQHGSTAQHGAAAHQLSAPHHPHQQHHLAPGHGVRPHQQHGMMPSPHTPPGGYPAARPGPPRSPHGPGGGPHHAIESPPTLASAPPPVSAGPTYPPAHYPHSVPSPPTSPSNRTMFLVLGALGLVLVGFAAVALMMFVLR